jgi:DNA polymerase elongation subunit (family B)
MNAHVNQCITGNYEHEGDAIIYLDTDSSYFSAWPMVKNDVTNGAIEWNKEVCVGLYNNIADQVNESFPAMCFEAFHAPEDNGKLIKCSRELVATKGLYITKKRYAVLIYDLENKRLDQMSLEEAKKKGVIYQVGKLKAMGLDLKRADTPKFVQDFLIEILTDLLTGSEQAVITDKILNFKKLFRNLAAWEKGKPMRVNNLTRYRELESRKGKANLPGHVRASLNWNNLRNLNSDRRSLPIVDGMKVIVCKLRGNPMNYTSVAYPVDELRLPDWFKTLPFDQDTMEEIVVDTKVDNLLGVLEWDLKALTNPNISTFKSLFSAR